MKKLTSKFAQGALAFVLLMGIVSLFSDMTHEGATSVLGDFLRLAGATRRRLALFPGSGSWSDMGFVSSPA